MTTWELVAVGLVMWVLVMVVVMAWMASAGRADRDLERDEDER